VNRVLIIKLGALGDFIQALGPMAAVRRHHPGAHLALLTTAPFRDFAAASPWFDEVLVDGRPGLADLGGLLRLRGLLRGFGRIYDLQTSDRSSWYFQLAGRLPEWSGIARGASHPHREPERDRMHTMDRQRDQLAECGIVEVRPPDLSWATADVSMFGLAERYALLVPGAAPHRPAKRWPIENFAAIARRLAAETIRPVIVGGPGDRAHGARITAELPAALDLTGRTSLLQLASLGRSAVAAIGNDTGPMHLLAGIGTPLTVLYSRESDPDLTAPRGPSVNILKADSLADLPVRAVAEALRLR